MVYMNIECVVLWPVALKYAINYLFTYLHTSLFLQTICFRYQEITQNTMIPSYDIMIIRKML